MEQATRNRLRHAVARCRSILEAAVGEVLQGRFGIHASGGVAHREDVSRLGALSGEDRRCLADLHAHLDHVEAGGCPPAEALARLARAVAFTHLNRLCAFKMMESRGIIREAVSRGVNSQGFQFYLAEDGHEEDARLHDSGRQDAAYRHFLLWQGEQLGGELGVLFDRHDPAARLFPPQRVLDEVLAEVNDEELKGVWAGDEAIGWVYQYFTPKEQRDQARKESQAPRNSYELAFRNQFFTPRYVVEFLTDNTLGRLWYEMRRGDTRLRAQCRYLVRRPEEVFLAAGEKPPAGQAGPDQEDRRRQPAYIPFRAKKDPREIKVLDPACGSGHFLLYCFDLLLAIYEEAYDDPDLGPPLRKDYPDRAGYSKAVPGLILGRNLHGIDIDRRACQIAALALWLRAQRAYQALGLKRREDRPPIRKGNIVCAEPMPGERAMLDDFLQGLREDRLESLMRRVVQAPVGGRLRATARMADDLAGLVRKTWESMRLAGEAGSLLKIEEELQSAVRKAQDEWETQHPLFRVTEYALGQGPVEKYSRFVAGHAEGQAGFWDVAEQLVLAALSDFADRTSEGQLQRVLFAEDAARGFGFLSACNSKYDVVLMNPPFGEPSLPARAFLYQHRPETARDLVAGFISRGLEWLSGGGMLGAITTRTIFFSDNLAQWRERALCGSESSLSLMADLGYGVLDAVVETAAYICTRQSVSDATFINVLHSADKRAELLGGIRQLGEGGMPARTVTRRLSGFRSLPGVKFAYHFHDYWVALLNRNEGHPAFVAKIGLSTGDDSRWLRCWWEIEETEAAHARWLWVAKGGEFSRYTSTIHMVVDWHSREEMNRVRNADYYGQAGATYTYRTTSNLSARVLNQDCLFSGPGPGVLPRNIQHAAFVLMYINSAVAAYCLEAIMGGGDSSAKGTAARDLEPSYLERLPAPAVDESTARWFADQVARLNNDLVQLISDESLPLFQGYRFQVNAGLAEAVCRDYRRAFGAYSRLFPLLRDCESRILGMLSVPAERIADLYSDTGYPMPSDHNLGKLPVEWPQSIDETGTSSSGEGISGVRFANKLAYYLHEGVERLAHRHLVAPEAICLWLSENGTPSQSHTFDAVAGFVSFWVGILYGRWDLHVALGQAEQAPEWAFAPLPRQSAARLRVPGASSLSPASSASAVAIPDGICVDDPTSDRDIVRGVQLVVEAIWADRAESVEKEACQLLGVKQLRDYIRRTGTGSFWDDHVKRYSKSRRKAPIYWLLQSSKKSFAVWLYYPRLDKDTLFKVLMQHVEPKWRLEGGDPANPGAVQQMRTRRVGLEGREAKQLDRDIERQEALVGELADFKEKLDKAAALHLEPDLNDGVLLNIAPLHELVPWKEAKACWQELLAGKYEWSSISRQLRQKGLVK